MAGKDRPLVVLPDRSRDEPAGWGVLEMGQVMKIVTSGPRMRTRGIGSGIRRCMPALQAGQIYFGGRNVVAGCHIPSAVMVSGLDH